MRQMGMELARALLVLALLFLNFAHLPPASASAGPDILTAQVDQSWCGDVPLGGTDTSHAPCHACRIGAAADLPPAPCAALRLPAEPQAIAFVLTQTDIAAPHLSTAARPRAPPARV